MEYCEGVTLHQRLVEGSMELDEVLEIGIQISDALEEARKKKIVHRDIKSSNILLTERKRGEGAGLRSGKTYSGS